MRSAQQSHRGHANGAACVVSSVHVYVHVRVLVQRVLAFYAFTKMNSDWSQEAGRSSCVPV